MADVDRTAVAWRLAAELARARGESQAAASVARAAATLAGAEVARVWMIDRTRGYRFSGAWPAQGNEDATVPSEVPRAIVFAAPLAGTAKAPFRSRLVIPLMAGQKPMGAVELLEKSRPAGAFTKDDASDLKDLTIAADSALEAVKISSQRERGQLEAITRLTRLFDIGRTFTATLDLDALKQLIVNRVRAVLEVENAYLWLLDPARENLELVAAAGPASEAVAGWTIPANDNLAGHVVESNQGYIVEDPEEIDGFETRLDAQAGLEAISLAASPVAFEDEAPIGVIEVVNKENGQIFDKDDLAFLNEAASTAALALANARRIDAERRASDLGALLDTAQELSASLEVPKVTFTLVHKAASVLPYKRASVGLLRGGRLELAAVSGQTFVDDKLSEMKALRELLSWSAGLDEGLYVVREEDGSIDAARPETREKFKVWFEEYGGCTFLTIPLKDDEGRLGVFAIESDVPYAFSGTSLEAAQLLAVQAAGAIRNATLYQQVPMVRMFKPIAKGQRRFQSLTGGRRLGTLIGAIVAVAALFLVPVPLRVAGDARVLPQRRLAVTSAVEGRIAQVLVREGDKVEEGQVLATLDSTDIAAGRESAMARYQAGLREQSRLRAEGLTGDAAVQQARLEGLKADLDLWSTRLSHADLRATVAGIVATPRIDELTGSRLAKGDVFCELIDPGQQEIEVAIAERDAGLVGVGQTVKTKLYAFPTRSFPAVVEQLGVAATVQEGSRVFLARARLTDAEGPLRPGMTGRAKVTTRSTSIAMVILRRPARWIWNIVWGWLP